MIFRSFFVRATNFSYKTRHRAKSTLHTTSTPSTLVQTFAFVPEATRNAL